MVSVSLDPTGGLEERQHCLQERVSVTLIRVDAEFGDPDWLLEGVVELLEVGDEGVGVVCAVVVCDDEVNLAIGTLFHKLREVADALVVLSTIGYRWRADPETFAGERLLDEPLVGFHCNVDGNEGTTTAILIRLVEAQNVLRKISQAVRVEEGRLRESPKSINVP